MDGNHKRINLYYLSVASLMIFSLVSLFSLGASLEVNFFSHLIGSFVSSLLVYFFLFNPIYIAILGFISLVSLLVVQKYFFPILQVIAENTYLLVDNIYNNLRGLENIQEENRIYFWALLVLVVTIFTLYIILKNKNIYILLIFYLPSFIYYWYNFYDEAYILLALFLLVFIFLMVLKTNKAFQLGPKMGHQLRYGLLYCLLIVIISLLVPKSNSYIRWEWLQTKVYNYFPFVEDLRHEENDIRRESKSIVNFSIGGYGDTVSKLGGPMVLTNKIVLTLNSTRPTYLRGSIKHIYTGTTWEKNDLKILPFEGDTYAYDEASFDKETISIVSELESTKTIFSPALALSIDLKNHTSYFDQENIPHIQDPIPKNTIYSIDYLVPKDYLSIQGGNIRSLSSSKDYLQVPTSISQRTIDLAKSIVEDEDDDLNKAKKIETYLRNNYKYSLKVSHVPDGVDFVDYFLFEEEKGYCTYFATTMAVFLRLENIPSRYIEGYIAREEIEENYYEITDKNAHAWVEAYIEPYGWLRFEPTPIYEPIQIRNESPIPENEVRDSDNPKVNERPEFIEEGSIGPDLPSQEDQDHDVLNMSKSKLNFPSLILVLALFIILIKLLLGIIYYIRERKRYKSMTVENKILFLYNKVLIVAGIFGSPIEPGETHFEYSQRIAYKFSYYDKFSIRDMTNIFVKTKYGNYLPTNEEVENGQEFYLNLISHLKNYLGLSKYLYYKYIKKMM